MTCPSRHSPSHANALLRGLEHNVKSINDIEYDPEVGCIIFIAEGRQTFNSQDNSLKGMSDISLPRRFTIETFHSQDVSHLGLDVSLPFCHLYGRFEMFTRKVNKF
jgi:hypothetical protein